MPNGQDLEGFKEWVKQNYNVSPLSSAWWNLTALSKLPPQDPTLRNYYQAWVRAGSPPAVAGLTPEAIRISKTPEFAKLRAEVEARRALNVVAPTVPPTGVTGVTPVEPLTYEQAVELRDRLGVGYYLDYDEDIGGWRVERDPNAVPQEITAWQQAQLDLARQEATATQAYQQQQMAWQQEQARMEQELIGQQYRAQLSAQPRTWLEYAAYTGETPVVQPWMMPLMPQEYGLQAGQPIPGWTAQGATQMPALTTPSRQYWARIGPTAQQQYLGYRQARTGATPEEEEWRLRATAPPGGSYGGLRWVR